VILLTGLAHIIGGFRTGDELERQRSRSSVLLGMMEIALGLLFLVGSLENSRAAYWAAGISPAASSSSATRSCFGVDLAAKAGAGRRAPETAPRAAVALGLSRRSFRKHWA
jgi:hypothetical protein